MLSRHRKFLMLLAAIAMMCVLPQVAVAGGEDPSVSLGIEAGYDGGPGFEDDSYAPAGTLYEGSTFDAKARLWTSVDGELTAENIVFRITWDDRRSVLTEDAVEFANPDFTNCSNDSVAPGEGSDEGFDVMTCTFDADFEMTAPDTKTVTVPVTPTAGTTGTDWADELKIFFNVSTSTMPNTSGSVSTGADIVITDRAVSDLAISVTGTNNLVVPAAGVNTSYLARITNYGPAVAPHAVAYFTLPFEATYVSAVVGDSAVTCEPADQSSENAEVGRYLWACPSGPLAVSESRQFGIGVKYVPGVGNGAAPFGKKLTLPATFTINAAAGFEMMDYVSHEDLFTSNDTASVTTSLTAPSVVVIPTQVCPAGKIGTVPNCTDAPKTFVGTMKGGSFIGGTAADKFTGGIGNETFKGGAGNDTGTGGKGNDKLFGEAGNDKLSGGLGNDSVDGGAGADNVSGDAGNDKLSGGTGNDKLNGGTGNDAINAKDGAKSVDTVTCGAGKDTVIADKKDKVSKDCEKVIRK